MKEWKSFVAGILGALLVFATIDFPIERVKAQSSWAIFPQGMTIMITSGSCPAWFSEVTALDGAMPYGTISAHSDIGGTGGANAITPTVNTLTAAAQTFTGSSATSSSNSAGTPAGTVTAPTFTGTPGTVPAQIFTGSSGTVPAQVASWPVGVPTFSGTPGTVPAQTFNGTPFSSVINHTHTVTVTWNVQGGTTAATAGTHVMTSTATGGSARAPTSGDVVSATTANPAGGVASITPAGTNSTAAFTPAGTVAWPVGVPTNATASFTPAGTNGTAAFTPAGSNSIPTFSGSALAGHTHTLTATGTNGSSSVTGTLNQFDNRPAFVKVIFCQKT